MSAKWDWIIKEESVDGRGPSIYICPDCRYEIESGFDEPYDEDGGWESGFYYCPHCGGRRVAEECIKKKVKINPIKGFKTWGSKAQSHFYKLEKYLDRAYKNTDDAEQEMFKIIQFCNKNYNSIEKLREPISKIKHDISDTQEIIFEIESEE